MGRILVERCSECAGELRDGQTCIDYFHQMLFWENEFPDYGPAVHHLMVLSYYLQHPSLYSPAGLEHARHLLVDFVVHEIAAEEIRQRSRQAVDSGQRKWKITGIPGAAGEYAQPVLWTMTAADVTAGGAAQYVENVHLWAQSIYASLLASGNL